VSKSSPGSIGEAFGRLGLKRPCDCECLRLCGRRSRLGREPLRLVREKVEFTGEMPVGGVFAAPLLPLLTEFVMRDFKDRVLELGRGT
jgi:hypothetical protein